MSKLIKQDVLSMVRPFVMRHHVNVISKKYKKRESNNKINSIITSVVIKHKG